MQTPRRVRLGTSNPDIHTGGPPEPSGPPVNPNPPQRPRAPMQGPLLDAAQTQILVTRELEQWESDLEPFRRKANQNWAMWNLQPVDADTNPFLSQVQSNYPTYAVEQILPRILGENPKMSYAPLDNERDSLIATILGKVASAQLKRMGFEYSARDFIRQALVAGYSVGKLYWVRRWEWRDTEAESTHPFVEGEQHLGSYTVRAKTKEKILVVNEPRFEVVNVLDFVWPLTAKSINDAQAVWQRRWITLEQLRAKQDEGVYQNVDLVMPSDTNRWTNAYDPQFASQGLTVTPPASLTGDKDDPTALIEVWERWADDRLTTIASRRVCIRDEPNPFDHKRKPYIDYTPIPRPFQMHGVGIIDTIRDSNDSLSTLMRQVSDAVTYLINPAFKSTGGVDWNNFTFQPGAHLDLDETEDVEPLVTPSVDIAAALQWRQAHQEDMQRYSGVFDIESGFTTGGTHTATGVATVIQNATMRITEMVNVFSYRTMRPFGWMQERLNAQYLDEGMLVDISDDPKAQAAWQQFVQEEQPTGILGRVRSLMTGGASGVPELGLVKIQPEMVRAEGRVEPIPQVGQDKASSEQQERSDASQALQAIAPILASPQNPINMAALADWALQKFGMDEQTRKKVEQTPQPQQMKAVTDALPNGATSGPSGPSGDNLPTGGVVGAPGAAGGVGPNGLGAR